MTWKAIARYEIGVSHEKQGMPCQDYGNYKILDDVIVGAVADGAGSAKYSDVGAKLVVDSVVSYLLHIAKRIQKRKLCTHSSSQTLSKERAKKLFTKTLSEACAALQQQADSKDYSIDELACTLLAFVASPEWVAAMQIGDGFIVTRATDSEYKLIFPPDKGEFANETTFVRSSNAIDEMRVKILPGKPEFICASTDGLEKLAIRISDWAPFPPFFQPLEEYLRETSDPEKEDEYLTNFLNSERLNARTDDDKTLLLCLFDKM